MIIIEDFNLTVILGCELWSLSQSLLWLLNIEQQYNRVITAGERTSNLKQFSSKQDLFLRS
jgi:hypothetical protein